MAKAKAEKKVEKKVEKKEQKINEKELPKVISVNIADNSLNGEFKEFSTGSKGWGVHGKVFINGVKCQVSCNVVIIGSKPTE